MFVKVKIVSKATIGMQEETDHESETEVTFVAYLPAGAVYSDGSRRWDIPPVDYVDPLGYWDITEEVYFLEVPTSL